MHLAETGARKGIQGFLLERGEYIPDYVSLYVDVREIEASVAAITKAGGKVIRPTFSPDGKNRICIVSDPEGHVFTLSQPGKSNSKSAAKPKAIPKTIPKTKAKSAKRK